MKLFFIMILASIQNFFRRALGIENDVLNVSQDITKLANAYAAVGKDIYDIFHALPFVAGALSLKASDAAKFTNPLVMEPNALLPLLTSIILAARQGQSSLEVSGELKPAVRTLLEQRGFKVEDNSGTDDNKATFILWT